MEFIVTKKQIYLIGVILGVLMTIFGFCAQLSYMYYNDDVKIYCDNGTIEMYKKNELNDIIFYCDNQINIYKYNDNSGLGVYFPNKDRVKLALNQQNLNNLNFSINYD